MCANKVEYGDYFLTYLWKLVSTPNSLHLSLNSKICLPYYTVFTVQSFLYHMSIVMDCYKQIML